MGSIGEIPGADDAADALTKQSVGICTPLWFLMKTDSVDFHSIGWASVESLSKSESLECIFDISFERDQSGENSNTNGDGRNGAAGDEADG